MVVSATSPVPLYLCCGLMLNLMTLFEYFQNVIILAVQGSTMADIYDKLDSIKDAVDSGQFPINVTHHGGRIRTIFPKKLTVLGLHIVMFV